MTPDDTPDPGRVVDARPGATPPTPEPPPAAEPAGDDAPAADEVLDAIEDEVEQAAEVVESDLSALATERDDYLDQLRRLQADF